LDSASFSSMRGNGIGNGSLKSSFQTKAYMRSTMLRMSSISTKDISRSSCVNSG